METDTSTRQYGFEHDDPCRYCDGECVPWESLPTHDMGNGVCEWCCRAITKEWPAAQTQDDDDTTVMHYHLCPHLPVRADSTTNHDESSESARSGRNEG